MKEEGWTDGWMDGVWKSYLFRYGAFTPAIFGVSHLMYRKLAPTSPNTAMIKHIRAEPVRFNFRRLLIYAPVTRNYSVVSTQSLFLGELTPFFRGKNL